MKTFGLCVFLLAFYALHHDFWNWRTAQPLAFGFLPVGLWYHAIYTLACSAVLWILVKIAWPTHLEKATDTVEPAERPR